MPAVFFTNLILLGGLAALAVPIVIHLLIKRKKQPVRFSTIQFFVKQDEQASKRRRLRNWLLLALRLLLVTLLVLAFTRPFTRIPAASNHQKKRIGIFVLDRSVSMNAATQGDTAWNRALKLVRSTLRDFRADDQAAIVTCSAHTEVFSGLMPAAAIARLIDGLVPEFTTGNLADGLRAALKLTPDDDATATTTIYIVTDLQKNNCLDLQSVTVPQHVEVKLLNGGELFTSNTAIADLRLEGQMKPEAQVTLKSFSDEDHSNVRLSVMVDGKEVVNAPVSLKAGLETNIVLPLPAFKPGWHSAEAHLLTKDALKFDDIRYHAFFIAAPLHVLCVETKPDVRIHEQDSFFVTSALQPGAEPGASIPTLFTVEIVNPSALARKLVTGKDSPSYATVVLPALRQIPDSAGEALAAYVRNGGGLLLFVGDGVSANRYNAEFRDLLPLQLAAVDTRGNAGWRLDTFEKHSPMFTAFQGVAGANLRLPEFTRRFGAQPLPAAAASTLAAFDDGIPLIASRSVDAGRVVLVNTSMDASWSDWPKRKSFVPWLHGTVNFLSRRSSKDAMQPSHLFTTGEDAEITLGQPWKGRSLLIHRGDAKAESVTIDEEGRLQHLGLETPGVYVMRDPNGIELRRWAVNLPPRESDLTALAPQDFQKQLARSKELQPVGLQAGLFGAANGEKEWWRVLLLAGLCLLFLEVFLANRTTA